MGKVMVALIEHIVQHVVQVGHAFWRIHGQDVFHDLVVHVGQSTEWRLIMKGCKLRRCRRRRRQELGYRTGQRRKGIRSKSIQIRRIDRSRYGIVWIRTRRACPSRYRSGGGRRSIGCLKRGERRSTRFGHGMYQGMLGENASHREEENTGKKSHLRLLRFPIGRGGGVGRKEEEEEKKKGEGKGGRKKKKIQADASWKDRRGRYRGTLIVFPSIHG